MTDKKPKKPPETDPEQSERFREAVRELEAAGDLSPAEEPFESAVKVITRPLDPRG